MILLPKFVAKLSPWTNSNLAVLKFLDQKRFWSEHIFWPNIFILKCFLDQKNLKSKFLDFQFFVDQNSFDQVFLNKCFCQAQPSSSLSWAEISQVLDPPNIFRKFGWPPLKNDDFLGRFRPIWGLFFNLFKTLPRVSEKTLTPPKNFENGLYPP